MRRVLEIALAASARSWPDRLHRHVLDHGGARIVGRLMGATQCLDSRYDVLFIDDVCSFLTPRLVAILRQRGRIVVGVYEMDDGPDAKRRLLEYGISDVIEADASPDEFLERAGASFDIAAPVRTEGPARHRGRVIGVTGVAPGVGATEVAVALAYRLSATVDTVLADVDPELPSVSQRLDLAPHPNLLTLVDIVTHQGSIEDALIQSRGVQKVVGGTSWRGGQTPIPPYEVAMALEALSETSQVVVADMGSSGPGEILDAAHSLLVVAAGDPVGVTRLLRQASRIRQVAETTPTLVVVNRCPGRRYLRLEIADEVGAALDGVPVALLPSDDAVPKAVWDGVHVARGHFVREVNRIADLVAGTVVS